MAINLWNLSSTEKNTIEFFIEHGIFPKEKMCEEGHQMKLYLGQRNQWNCNKSTCQKKCFEKWHIFNIFSTMILFFILFELFVITKQKSEDCPSNLKRLDCFRYHPHVCGDDQDPKVTPCVKNSCGCEYPLVLHNGDCIPLSRCPQRCDMNSTFTNCDTVCPRRCANLKKTSHPCSLRCVKNSCQCNVGYLLNDTNHCVLLEDCPGYDLPRTTTIKTTTRKPTKPKCRKNMVYSKCPNKEEFICSNKFEPKESCGKPRCICKKECANYKKKCIKLWKCKHKLAEELEKKISKKSKKN
uniref:TIL domain-containing protein n=2 Tax=Strongyloides stercoralis TaxID=6248 RepID=A0AAF5DN69_STRER